MSWPVRDCPAHRCCALGFASGTLCLACGQQVLDTIDGLAVVSPPPVLIAEAKAAWRDNQGVRDFTADALTHQTGDQDGQAAGTRGS